MKKTVKYPEGHFVGVWMVIGVLIFSGIGIPLSISTGNPGLIGVGPALGIALGLAIGQSIENKYKEEGKIRPLTKEEKRRQKILVIVGLVVLLLGVAAFLLLFLSSR